MGFKTRGPGPPGPPGPLGTPHTPRFAVCLVFMSIYILVLLAGGATAEGNKKYNMGTLCKDHFLQQQHRKIDGAELKSQNERNLNCIITFQTHSVLQFFVLRFDELHLDCNDRLYIYDGAHAVNTPKWDLSCKDTRDSVGTIPFRTNHVTLKYVTDNWGTEQFGFSLVITAVKDPQNSCSDFKCKTRGEYCIHTDLVCDGVNHCADGSDEMASEKCGGDDIGLVLGMSVTFLVVATVSALLILGAAVVGIAVCVYRQNPPSAPGAALNSSANPFHPVPHVHVHAGLNGAGHMGLGTTTLSGLGQPLSQPGNWFCPVGTPLGYSGVRARLYCCLVK